MNIYSIISQKRDGKRLGKKEIDFFVSSYAQGEIPDYQASALLMAIFLKGMDFSETTFLTEAMMNSGEVLDLSSIPGTKVDKHSTGGVGDKISLIVAPLVSACGIPVPMLSGRGLGHTGGTLDKLEAIPGFKTNLSTLEFKNIVSEIGLGIMGQTEKIAPADKKLYALRDVTATVESIPLITASILSKKFASGVDAIVFDVKVGNGAFMKDKKEAIFLAKHLVSISKNMKRKSVAVLTDMNEPLGEAVGNSLEVIEAINALKGRGPADLFEVTLALGAEMLVLGKRAKNLDEGKTELKRIWDSGKGLEKFKQMVERQRGNVSIIDDYSLFPQAKYQIEIKSWQSGFVKAIDTLRIGLAANELGAGRKKLDSVVDPAVGFLIKKKVGDKVEKGESLAIIFANNMDKGKNAGKEIEQSFKFSKTKVSKLKKTLGRTNK